MPQEDRRIIFSNEEVYKALFTLRDQKGMKPMPFGEIITAGFDTQNRDNIFFMLEDRIEQVHTKVEHKRDFVAASLMVFCRGVGIPLPKNAKKSVMIKEGAVILRVQI